MDQPIQHILAPVDFSEAGKAALQTAIVLCKQHDAVLHLLYVLENRFVISNQPPGIDLQAMVDELNNKARTNLYNVYESILQEHAIKVQLHMPTGIPYDEICCTADEMLVDLIVMGKHGTAGIKEFLTGTTAAAVIKNATMPVLTIPAYCKVSAFREILFPVRPVKGIIDKYQFMQSFLKGESSSVHIANLYLQHEAEERLFLNDQEELLEIMPLIVETDLTCSKKLYVCRDFASTVLDLSKALPVDLVVINACLDYHPTGFFLSAYTQQVINQARVPVLNFRNGINVFGKNVQLRDNNDGALRRSA